MHLKTDMVQAVEQARRNNSREDSKGQLQVATHKGIEEYDLEDASNHNIENVFEIKMDRLSCSTILFEKDQAQAERKYYVDQKSKRPVSKTNADRGKGRFFEKNRVGNRQEETEAKDHEQISHQQMDDL